MSTVDSIGEKLMQIDLNQVLTFLTHSTELLLVAFADIIIIDTLLLLGGIKSGLLRFLVGLSILLATLMKMKIALLLFNLIGLPLLLALAVGGIFLRIILAPKKAVSKMRKKK